MKKVILPTVEPVVPPDDEYDKIIEKESKHYTSSKKLPPILKNKYWLMMLEEQKIRINEEFVEEKINLI